MTPPLKANVWLRTVASGSAIVHALVAIAILRAPVSSTSVLYQVAPPVIWAGIVCTAALLLVLSWIHPPLVRWGFTVAGLFWGTAATASAIQAVLTGTPNGWFTAIFLAYICFLHIAKCWISPYQIALPPVIAGPHIDVDTDG